MRIRVKSRKYNLDIDLEHKINVVRGDSATGKTSLIKILDEYRTVVKPQLDDGFRLAIVTPGGVHVFSEKKVVYVIDENVELDNELVSQIKNSSDSYFLIFRRADLSTLNFSIEAVYNLIMDNGVHKLQSVLQHETPPTTGDKVKPDNVLVEDSGKGLDWFQWLFLKANIRVQTTNGKDMVLSKVEEELKTSSNTLLVMFDAASFGNHIIKFINLCKQYNSRVFYCSRYRSFEYLVLQSNMFKNKFISYSIDVPVFEEAYYEQHLADLSNSRYGTLSHSSSAGLPRCYYEPCCIYTGKKGRDCTFGLSGDDKFIAMLNGTELHALLQVAGRM